MDRYKKKNLKFMGYGKDIRVSELNSCRANCRYERYSLLRDLDCSDGEDFDSPIVEQDPKENVAEKKQEAVPEKKKEIVPIKKQMIPDKKQLTVKKKDSKIPTITKSIPPPTARMQMLKKWKEEKEMKKQKELKSKIAPFRAGISKADATHGSKIFHQSKNSVSSLSSNSSNVSSRIFNPKLSNKEPSSNLTKKVLPPPISKPPVNKVSHTNIIKRIPPPVTAKTSVNKEMPNKVLTKQSTLPTSMREINKKIPLPKFTRATTLQNDQTAKSRLPKPPLKVANKNEQANAFKAPAKLPERLPRNIKKAFPQPSPLTSKKTENSNCTEENTESSSGKQIAKRDPLPRAVKSSSTQIQREANIKPKLEKPVIVSEEQKDSIKEDLKSSPSNSVKVDDPSICEFTLNESELDPNEDDHNDVKDVTFKCELSHIEPVKAPSKSFAPDNFVFSPPHELKSSLFLEGGLSAIFTRTKPGQDRTSTPKTEFLNISSKVDVSSSEMKSSSDENKCSLNVDVNDDSLFLKSHEAIPERIFSKDVENFDESLKGADTKHVSEANAKDNCEIQELPQTKLDSLKEPLVDTPKSHTKISPRRSLRFSVRKMSSSSEDLFMVSRPTFFGSPSAEENESKKIERSQSVLTYDFEKLHLETTDISQESHKKSYFLRNTPARLAKVSLLFTPPRKSIVNPLKASEKDNLMSFSPGF